MESKVLREHQASVRKQQNQYLRDSIDLLKQKRKGKRQRSLVNKAIQVRLNMEMIIAMEDRLTLLKQMVKRGEI